MKQLTLQVLYRDIQVVRRNKKPKKPKKRKEKMKIEGAGMILREIEDTQFDEDAVYTIFKDWEDSSGIYTRERARKDVDQWARLNAKVIRPLWDNGPLLTDKSRWTCTLLALLPDGTNPDIPIGIHSNACKGKDMTIILQAIREDYRGLGHSKTMNLILTRWGFEYVGVETAKMLIFRDRMEVRGLIAHLGQDEGEEETSPRTGKVMIRTMQTAQMYWDRKSRNPVEAGVAITVTGLPEYDGVLEL